MISSLRELLRSDNLTGGSVTWTVAVVAALFVGSIALSAVLLVHLPATYFTGDKPRGGGANRHSVLRFAAQFAKNLVGAVLVGVGLLMLLTPGQGVLTILIGLVLLDFPWKQRLLRGVIGRPDVLRAVNRLRARFGKPPVLVNGGSPQGP